MDMYDVVIIGAGPAGLSAAIYVARAKYKVLVLEKEKMGGQITITSEIVNYPGIERTDGSKLTQAMKHQAEAFGAEFRMDEVKDVEVEKDIKIIKGKKHEYRALGMIIATGAQPRKLGFPGELQLQGRGVAYCATCDGEFFTGKQVFVVGGGFAAVEEGIFLTKYAKQVTMIVREEDFTCAKTVAEQIKKHPKISVKFHTEVEEVRGNTILDYARFRDNHTGETWDYQEDMGFGMFIFAGYVPSSELFQGKVEIDPQGYIITDINKKTNVSGVYAAGDICVKNLRQVVTAVSDGAVAATSLEKHVSELHERLQLPEFERKEAKLSELSSMSETGAKEPLPKEIQGTASEQVHIGEGAEGDLFIDKETKDQIQQVFERFESTIVLRAALGADELSKEMEGFIREFDGMNNRIRVMLVKNTERDNVKPYIEILRGDGRKTGIRFYGVPGGHEFNSFIVAMYNVAGPGQQTEPELMQKIKDIKKEYNLQVLVSLSCTMCPEVVMGAQRIAALNDRVSAKVYDLKHFPELKQKYNVMSVPCLIINEEQVVFGKKGIGDILELLNN